MKDEEQEETCFCTTYENSVCITTQVHNILQQPEMMSGNDAGRMFDLGFITKQKLYNNITKNGVDQRENHSLTSKRSVNGWANLSNTNLISVHSS